MGIEKFRGLFNVDLVPIRRGSVLLLFNLRKFEVNQDFMSRKAIGEGGWGEFRVGFG